MTGLTPRRIRHGIELVWALVSRDQKARYRNTALGLVWALVHPLLFLCVFYFLFALVLGIQIEHYAAYVFSGVIAWTWFQASIAEATQCISSNPGLVAQPRMPVAAIVVATVVSNLVPFLISLPPLLVLMLIEGAAPGLSLVALPAVIVIQFTMMLAVCYFAAALNVPFRDVQQIIFSLLLLGYFATPIFYDTSMLSEGAQRLLALNPMVHVLDGYRAILLHGAWPDWSTLGIVFVLSLVGLGLGLTVFQMGRLRFLEEI
ncbi:ABC transporter permease [Rhodobacterales bacterium HKCCE2091]|nr:ABC transporter permease [Rhodobacterales bacterium HKCCE2091]